MRKTVKPPNPFRKKLAELKLALSAQRDELRMCDVSIKTLENELALGTQAVKLQEKRIAELETQLKKANENTDWYRRQHNCQIDISLERNRLVREILSKMPRDIKGTYYIPIEKMEDLLIKNLEKR
jgi:predicted  nucleic acid-binding Zn-ribbon protein